MIRQMTPEEIEVHDHKLEQFWKDLDWNTKNDIMHMFEPFIEKASCEHEWVDPNEYDNELNKDTLYCRKCHHKKPLWYDKT